VQRGLLPVSGAADHQVPLEAPGVLRAAWPVVLVGFHPVSFLITYFL